MSGATWKVSLATGWVLLVGSAWAQEASFLQPAQAGGPPATSSSQRFIFREFGRADGTLLSSWAEDLTGQLEKKLGMRAPFHQLEILRCSAVQQNPTDVGALRMGQDFIEGLLQQWLVVVNPEHVEEEELLESFTQLLLNRYLLSIGSRRGTGKKGMSLPDWFSIGLAQDLKPELRARNLEFVGERNRNGIHPSMESIVGLDVLPQGRSEEKVYCGLMIHWLSDEIQRNVTWAGFLQRLVAGKSVDADWLAKKVLDVGSVAKAEQDWQAWLSERSEQRPDPVGISFEAVASLKKRLQLEVEASGILRDVGLRDLIRDRKEDWARTAARTMEPGLRQMAATGAPEMRKVAGAYATLLDRIASGSKKRGGVFGFGRSRVSAADLEQELEAAEALLVALEKDVAIRSHYMKTVETSWQEVPEEPSTDALEEQRRLFLQQIRQRIEK